MPISRENANGCVNGLPEAEGHKFDPLPSCHFGIIDCHLDSLTAPAKQRTTASVSAHTLRAHPACVRSLRQSAPSCGCDMTHRALDDSRCPKTDRNCLGAVLYDRPPLLPLVGNRSIIRSPAGTRTTSDTFANGCHNRGGTHWVSDRLRCAF